MYVLRAAAAQTGISLAQQNAVGQARMGARNAAIQAAATQISRRALTPVEVNSVIHYIKHEVEAGKGGQTLSAGQEHAIADLLSKNGQTLIDPDIPLNVETPDKVQIIRAGENADHVLLLSIRRVSIFSAYVARIDAAGHVTRVPVRRAAPTFSRVVPVAPPNTQLIHDQHIATIASATVFGLQAALGVLLMVAGIYFFLRRTAGIRLHWIYAAGKICVSVVGSIQLLPASFGPQASLNFPIGTPLELAGCVYPVAVIVILCSPTLRPGADPSREGAFSGTGAISAVVAMYSALIDGCYGFFALVGSAEKSRVALVTSFSLIANFAIDILLLLAARRLLWSKAHGVRSHWYYAGTKLAFGMVAVIAVGYQTGTDFPEVIVLVPLALTLIYPVVLLFRLPRRRDGRAGFAVAIAD